MIKARQRVLEPLQFQQRNAAVVECFGKGRIDRDCPVQARQRLVETLQRKEGDRASIVRSGDLRVQGQCKIDMVQRLRVTALLAMHDPQEMPSFKMSGICLEDLPENGCRIGKSAGLMQLKTVLQEHCRGYCRVLASGDHIMHVPDSAASEIATSA